MQILPVDQRLVQGLAGTLELIPADVEGAPISLDGPVTATITDHLGGTVATDLDATVDEGGVWTVPIAPALTADLARWTAVWTDADTGNVWTTYVEVTGGHAFTVAQARAIDPALGPISNRRIITTRLVVEAEAEWILDVALTPRVFVETIDGDGSAFARVNVNACRRLISIADGDRDLTPGATLDASGLLRRPAGFPPGAANLTVVFEAGLDRPPVDLRDAMVTREKVLLQRPDTEVPLRAMRFDSDAGGGSGVFRLDRASTYRTGVPDVDAVYSRHSRRPPSTDGAPGPAHGQYDLDPQTPNLFHRWRS